MLGQEHQQTVIFDFASDAEPWPSIDDPVMGGRSRSTMTIEGDVAVFKGFVSLENNGGFASLRSRPAAHDLSGFDGIVLRILGEGKTYGVRLRTGNVAPEARGRNAADGVNYQVKLATEAGRWVEARLSFDAFRPVFRGRRVKNYPALDPAAIKTFGLIISDKQEGSFRLEIGWIKAYKN